MTVAGLAARRLGLRDYVPVWRAMQQFTEQRDAGTPDEVAEQDWDTATASSSG